MLPRVNVTNNKMTSVQEEFRGLNHNSFLEEVELYDMKNMSVDNYPYASPRRKRVKYTDFGIYNGKKCNGIATKQGFCFVEGNRFYYKSNDDDTYHDIGEVEDSEKQFVSLGAYILVFPDKKYFWSVMYNHYNDEEWLVSHGLKQSPYFGSLEAELSFNHFKMNMCNVYGEDYKITIESSEQPSEEYEKNGTIWLDTSGTTAKLMKYSSSYSGWIEILSNYIKITVDMDITELFSAYDGVTLSGFPDILEAFNSATVLYNVEKCNDGTARSFFVIPGIFEGSKLADVYDGYYFYFDPEDNSLEYEAGELPIKIERTVPDMDFVCEQDNRLWGCSNNDHQIFVSKQGSPFNFNCFVGLPTDSDVITIGSDGDFTGCISHLGYVLFFKEDKVHKIYGTKPSNYQVTEVALRGVQAGCEKSLCIVNETLFYKAKNGVMMYQGSLPECISNDLGTEQYSDAVAGMCGNKYYISMKDSNNVWWLFVYDCNTGMWHKEDNTHFKYVLSTLSELFYIDGDDFNLHSILGTGDEITVKRLVKSGINENAEYESFIYTPTLESDFEWNIETGDLYSGSIDNKYISRLRILMELMKDTTINVYLKYDNEKNWNCVYSKHHKYTGSIKDTFNIPIVPQRARRMKLKISGIGDCLIQAIAKSIEQGSEI